MDRVTRTTRQRLPRFHSCVRPIRGNEAISQPRGRHARVPGAARKNTAQSQFAMLAPGQPARRSLGPAVQSNPAEPAYFRAYALVRGRPLTGPFVALRAPKINLVIHYTPRQRSRAQ